MLGRRRLGLRRGSRPVRSVAPSPNATHRPSLRCRYANCRDHRPRLRRRRLRRCAPSGWERVTSRRALARMLRFHSYPFRQLALFAPLAPEPWSAGAAPFGLPECSTLGPLGRSVAPARTPVTRQGPPSLFTYARRWLHVGIPTGRPFFGLALAGVRVTRPVTPSALVGALEK